MKSILKILFLFFLFSFFACSNDDDALIIDSNLLKIKNIAHISTRDTIQENFYYNEEGLLLAIENFRSGRGTILLKYANERFAKYGCMDITYDSLGRIEKEECISSYEMLLIKKKDYQYNSDGKISNIKDFFSEEFLALLSDDQLSSYKQQEYFLYWENNNVKKVKYYLNGAFYSEHTYEYDNSINYKSGIPISLKIGAELSENNVISTSTTYADGGLDPFCFTCPSILEYDEQGRIFKITEPNEGFGGADPRIKLITYAN
ncbi:hypothetical protein [Ascidiimonas sp. W6]|uniref:hypothetical protein n=1 Tax=Ascidiimonas meishanensis TaxID=3128903 RepID=UPI0030EC8328